MNNTHGDIEPLACNMLAIKAEDRERHGADWRRLMAQADAVKALSAGYAFRFQPGDDALMLAARIVARERLCCPFFRFDIAIEPHYGPMWLYLSGREGVKQFIEAEFAEVLSRFQ